MSTNQAVAFVSGAAVITAFWVASPFPTFACLLGSALSGFIWGFLVQEYVR